jgi:hypothetical protein
MDHAKTCNRNSGAAPMRHNITLRSWRRVCFHVGARSSKDPGLQLLQGWARDGMRPATTARSRPLGQVTADGGKHVLGDIFSVATSASAVGAGLTGVRQHVAALAEPHAYRQ